MIKKINKLSFQYILICFLSFQLGCTKKNSAATSDSEGTSTESGSVTLTFTSPLVASTITSASQVFQWATTLGGTKTLRATNPYLVNVYSQSSCAGTATTTAFSSSNSYTLSDIKHSSVYSISVIAYDSNNTATSPVCSVAVTGNSVISVLQVGASAAYQDIEIDVTNKLAYLAANYTNTLVDVVDFTTEASPSLFRSITSSSSPSTSYSNSRGIKLYNSGRRLVVGADSGSAMELFDLTSDPRNGTWTKLATQTGLTNFRKIAKVDDSNASSTRVYAALRRGVAIVDITEPAGTSVTTTVIQTTFGGNCFGNGALLANNSLMLSGCYDNTSSIQLWNLSTLVTDLSITNPDPGSGTNNWTTTVNSDGSKIFVGGVVGQFLTYSASDSPVVQSRYRINFASGSARDSAFSEESGQTYLYVVRGNRYIDKWNVSSMSSPTHVGQLDLTSSGATSELYGIKIDATNRKAYIATFGGQFIILNTDMLPAPTVTYTAY